MSIQNLTFMYSVYLQRLKQYWNYYSSLPAVYVHLQNDISRSLATNKFRLSIHYKFNISKTIHDSPLTLVLTGCIIRSGFKIARVSCRRLRPIWKQKKQATSWAPGKNLHNVRPKNSKTSFSCLLLISQSGNDHSREAHSLNGKKIP